MTARDRHGVYSIVDGFQKIEGADPQSFEVLSANYSRDHRAVYCLICDLVTVKPQEIAGADPESFQVLADGHGKDKHAIYSEKEKVKDLDYASFQAMNVMYARDKNAVYYSENILEGADPQTFDVIKDSPYAQDKSGRYFNGTRLQN